MKPGLKIQRIEKRDLEEILDIERQSFSCPWSKEAFLEELNNKNAYLWMLKIYSQGKERVVSYIDFWIVYHEMHIMNLATHPGYRRRGYGSLLLGSAIDFARRHEVKLATLEVRRSNYEAQRIYKRFGFRVIMIRPQYYPDNREDAIVMALSLVEKSKSI